MLESEAAHNVPDGDVVAEDPWALSDSDVVPEPEDQVVQALPVPRRPRGRPKGAWGRARKLAEATAPSALIAT